MNKAETLLNEILEADMATYTATPETEPHIVIGNDRSITVPTELQKIAVQFDHNIETVTFDCPRYWDENDMSTMAIYINYRRSDGVLGSYLATNPIVDSNNPDIMHFDWTISQNVTEVKGNISFLVCIRKTDTEGNVSNHWNSELCNELYVSEGLETKDTILAKQPDLVTQLVQLVTKYEKITSIDISGLEKDVSTLKEDLSIKAVAKKNKLYIKGILTVDKWKSDRLTEYDSVMAMFLKIDITAGHTYYVNGTSVNTSFPLALLVDSNDKIIKKIYMGDNTAVNDYEITAPASCAAIYINGKKWENGKGYNYPSVYEYRYSNDELENICLLLNKKQEKRYIWDKSATIITEKNKFVKANGNGVTIESNNVSGGYSYSKILYNCLDLYRFWGICKTDVIPIVICVDEYNNIIKTYGKTGDVYKGAILSHIPETTKYIYINGTTELVASADIAREKSMTSLIDNRKIGVCFGDSITQGANVYIAHDITPYEDYPSVVENLLGCKIYNGGLGGSTYASGRTIDFENVVNCIINKNFSTVLDGIEQYKLNKSALLQYADIAKLDFNDVDFITIALGTNDWNFGTLSEKIVTAMRNSISKLLTAYPHLKIYIFTPIFRFNIQNSNKDSDTFVNPTSNLKLHDLCDIIINCAKEFNIPCKDMYYECGINKYTKSLYMGDDTHPNAKGYFIIGERIGKFINSN